MKVNISVGGRYRCVCYQKMAIQKYPSKLLFINFIQRNPNFVDKLICEMEQASIFWKATTPRRTYMEIEIRFIIRKFDYY